MRRARAVGAHTRDLGALPVCSVESHLEILEELRAIGDDAGADLVEGLDGVPSGFASGLSIRGGTIPTSTALATRDVSHVSCTASSASASGPSIL